MQQHATEQWSNTVVVSTMCRYPENIASNISSATWSNRLQCVVLIFPNHFGRLWRAPARCNELMQWSSLNQGLVNVPIEHHPSIGDIISNRYLKVMFKIPKKGHLPTHVNPSLNHTPSFLGRPKLDTLSEARHVPSGASRLNRRFLRPMGHFPPMHTYASEAGWRHDSVGCSEFRYTPKNEWHYPWDPCML